MSEPWNSNPLCKVCGAELKDLKEQEFELCSSCEEPEPKPSDWHREHDSQDMER